MHTWHWKTWQGLPYLTCSLLEAWPHGFFTQQSWPRLPADLVGALQADAQVYRVKQVHGDRVLSPSEMGGALAAEGAAEREAGADCPTWPDGDGVVTEQQAQAAWVCSADCVPALIADVETGLVAAVHAGWRGTAATIVPKAIARLQAHGSQLQNLRVALGPAISGDVYQVSTTVAAEVGATVVPVAVSSGLADPEPNAVDQILEALHQLEDSPILHDAQPGRARLDVRRVNALQLRQLGLQPQQVAIAPYCTFQNSQHFFSYRRERLKKVQWSGIVSVR